MNIPKILSTKERLKILKFVIYKIEPLNVNKIASELNLSKGLVSKFFDILTKEGLIKRTGKSYSYKIIRVRRQLKSC